IGVEEEIERGTIYVLRSQSDHPLVAEHRELIHKIGVTGGKVESRIANAAHDATYLLADVEVVATYKLASINRRKLEALFHRIFSPAQLELTIYDRFGDRKSTRLNSSHVKNSYAVFCLKKKIEALLDAREDKSVGAV